MIVPILVSALAGTLLMTIFSYIVSRITHQQYREPDLLANMIMKLVPFSLEKKWDFLIGSFAHYIAGLGFMLAYWLLWKYTVLEANMIFAVIAGFLSGLAGVVIWMITFALHPDPPKIHFWGYYGQLVIAHIFFGVGATGTFMMFYM